MTFNGLGTLTQSEKVLHGFRKPKFFSGWPRNFVFPIKGHPLSGRMVSSKCIYFVRVNDCFFRAPSRKCEVWKTRDRDPAWLEKYGKE